MHKSYDMNETKVHPGLQLEQIFYLGLTMVMLAEFTGRWLCPFWLDEFWLINEFYYIEYLDVNSGTRPFHLIKIFANQGMHHLLFGVTITCLIAMNWSKLRIPALAMLLPCHLVILEIQPVIRHVGDFFLNGILICLLFGLSRKYLYLAIFCGLFWFSVAINKFMGIGWGNGYSHGLASILDNDQVINQWLVNLRESFPPELLEFASVLTPWVQLAFAIACIYGIFCKNIKVRWILCIILPASFLLALQVSFTVGLFPTKVLS